MNILQYLLISIPMISALTCGIIFLVIFSRSFSIVENKIRLTLGSYYVLLIVLWLSASYAFAFPEIGLYLLPILFVLIYLLQDIFKQFIDLLILLTNESFFRVDYKLITAVLISSMVSIYVIDIKINVQLDLEDILYECIYLFSSVILIYNMIIYWRSYYISRKKINQIVNKFNWLSILLISRSVYIILFIINYYRHIWIDIIIVLLISLQHIILTFNILKRNIIDKIRFETSSKIMLSSGQIIEVDKLKKMVSENLHANQSSLINEEMIFNYFQNEKPYLNKEFKLDDIVNHFGINRSYISKFINVTFNKNVTQLINHWRLIEVESLQKKHPRVELEKLVVRAGFSDYRHYLRAIENTKHTKK